MKPDDRRNALTVTEANLLWLEELGNRAKATQILANDELQAAIIAAQNYAGTTPTDGTIAYSDPTGQTAIRAGATALRATEVRRCWLAELDSIHETVARLRDITGRAHHDAVLLNQPRNMATTIRSLRWMTVIPNNRAMTIHTTTISPEDLAEYDHAIGWAHDRSTALRSGSLTTSSGKRCPSVHGVIEAARKATADAPPPPVQKEPDGCVSCARDRGPDGRVHFAPIDIKNHNARSMCRRCGDYTSGEGEWPPIEAVRYMHRTGKNWTWKIIQEAKRTERAS